MLITAPDFLEHNQEIVAQYSRLGVRPTQSCIPYEWEGVVTEGTAAWAESNAICFGNSYCGLQTNRESGLSALACALTGYAPYYGLLTEEARKPNLEVTVSGGPGGSGRLFRSWATGSASSAKATGACLMARFR